jgi:hypothetical protein
VIPSSSATAEIDRIGDRDHFVQFYKADQTLVDCVARFFAVGFAKGNVAVIIATREHREAIESRLRELGVNLNALRESGGYSAFDAREMLSNFMVDGRPNPHRFRALLGTWMDVAVRSGAGVRAFGEMVALLWAEGNEAGAIELEHLWNDLSETHEFALFCAYPAAAIENDDLKNSFTHVCRAHSRVISN